MPNSVSHDEARERALLRSRAGCGTCRRRRKKCDYTKPICSECSRLGLVCVWLPGRMGLPQAIQAGVCTSAVLTVKNQRNLGDPNDFDHPSLLRASPTSVLESQKSKQLEQYLFERGHVMFDITTPDIPQLMQLNLFKVGFPIARDHQDVLMARQALAAAQLSLKHPHLVNAALTYYQSAIKGLSKRLEEEQNTPSEMACIAAAYFNLFEMTIFQTPSSRRLHFLGFHNIVHQKLQTAPRIWGPTRAILETYVHMVATHCTFYSEEVMSSSGVTIAYVDQLISLLNEIERPLGPEVLGIPEDLLSIVFQLNFIRATAIKSHGLEKSGTVSQNLTKICQTLETWTLAPTLFNPIYSKRRLVARLYHMACLVFSRKLIDPHISELDPLISEPVASAVATLQAIPSQPAPPIVTGWPLTILGLAAGDETAFKIIRRRAEEFIGVCGYRGFKTMIALLDAAHIGTGPTDPNFIGLGMLFRDDMLRTVHI